MCDITIVREKQVREFFYLSWMFCVEVFFSKSVWCISVCHKNSLASNGEIILPSPYDLSEEYTEQTQHKSGAHVVQERAEWVFFLMHPSADLCVRGVTPFACAWPSSSLVVL